MNQIERFMGKLTLPQEFLVKLLNNYRLLGMYMEEILRIYLIFVETVSRI